MPNTMRGRRIPVGAEQEATAATVPQVIKDTGGIAAGIATLNIGAPESRAVEIDRNLYPSHQQRQFPPLPVAVHVDESDVLQPLQLSFQGEQLVRWVFGLRRLA